MNISKLVKNVTILVSPLLLFPALIVPYGVLNQRFVVERFGCGCPKLDINGNMINSYFNANYFTMLFWSFISICAIVLSLFLSKKYLVIKCGSGFHISLPYLLFQFYCHISFANL